MKVLSTYWRDQMVIKNLGDYVTQAILEAKGHEYERYGSRKVYPTDKVLVATGSILESGILSQIPCDIIVWGSGSQGNFFDVNQPNLKIVAVRGPKTRDLLKLPPNIPLGDPALLLPQLYPILRRKSKGKVLYAPHCAERDGLTQAHFNSTGADEFLDMTCKNSEFVSRLKEICSADFILCGSLHAMVIAQAYGIPWALCIPEGVKLVMPFKHADWFSYLGLEPFTVSNIADGRAWWDEYGSQGKIRDLEPLNNSFPL